MSMKSKIALLAIVFLTACGSGPGSDVVATVDNESITTDEVAEYMRQSGYGSNLADVEKAVEELVDIKLAKVRAEHRYQPTLPESLQIKEWREMLLINQFREDVVWSQAKVDEAKLREWYDENVTEEVSARHILIRVEAEATDEEREVARQKADSLLQVVQGGADFATVAQENSEDPGSAARGGSLGYFGSGQMVEPFEQAAYATPAGEITPQLVETMFGYHIIKVDDKRKQDFEDVREEIEDQLERPGRQEAEDAYVTQLMESSGLEFWEDNIAILISLVRQDPQREPTAEERELMLATFEGGEIRLQEIWELYLVLPEGNRRQIEQLDMEGMVLALSSMAQQRLLIARANERETVLDTTRQGQLDERIGALYLDAYLRQAQVEIQAVTDEDVETYFEEHREFYGDAEFEEVRQEIRAIIYGQRGREANSREARMALVAAVADSQRPRSTISINEDTYQRVLVTLRENSGEQDQSAG